MPNVEFLQKHMNRLAVNNFHLLRRVILASIHRSRMYLISFLPPGVDDSMEDHVLHIGERANDVEQQLWAIGRSHHDDRVVPVAAVRDADVGPRSSAATAAPPRSVNTLDPLVVSVSEHDLMQPPPPIHCPGRGERSLGSVEVIVSLEDVAEHLFYRCEPLWVVDSCSSHIVGDMDHCSGSGVVGPYLSIRHVALEG